MEKDSIILSKKVISIIKRNNIKNHGDFYCPNCLHYFATKNKHESHKKVCKNKNFCNFVMPSEDTIILEFNQNKKSDKAPFIIYADLECLLGKMDGYKNNPENLSTTKVISNNLSGFSMSRISSFENIEHKYDVYRGNDCMKNFCEFLKEHTMKIINFKKEKMKLLIEEQQESYENFICKETFENNYVKDNNIAKLEIIAIIQEDIEALSVAYVI